MINIAIIGGGAAGLTAAIAACETNKDCAVTIFDRMDRVGKKLLTTGNGRCNLTNKKAADTYPNSNVPIHYHGEQPEFCTYALSKFGVDETVGFFGAMGMLTCFEGDKCFPNSLQAATVVDILRFYCEKLGVKFALSKQIDLIKKSGEIFIVDGAKFDRVIVAAGGKSSPHLGSNGSGYKLLEQFGHKCSPLSPAITQIKTDTTYVKQVKGIKIDANAAIFSDGRKIREEFGQVLFTDYGLSGPPVFQLSGIASKCRKPYIELDLMPQYDFAKICGFITNIIKNPFKSDLCADNLLTPIINKRLGQIVMKYCGFKLTAPCNGLSEKDVKSVAAALKHFRIDVTGVQGFANAQVTAGGILTNGFNNKTMMSKKVKNLYAVGEVLDIDGDCGGYNLQWAFSSGHIAGTHAARENL